MFQYTCLPFGLSSAPRIFTKVLKPIFATLRERGHSVLGYLDDTILLADSILDCEKAVTECVGLFQDLGFVVHEKKSVFEPTQSLMFLGFVLNSIDMTVTLTPEKKANIKTLCQDFVQLSEAPIRTVARVIGKLVAACPGSDYGLVFCKPLEIAKNKALGENFGNFDAIMPITSEMKACFEWWRDNVFQQFRNIDHAEPDLSVFTDASKKGWGAYILHGNKAKGQWSVVESERHINELELLAVLFALKSLCTAIRAVHIRIVSDNTTTVSYINNQGGAKSPGCNEVAQQIWKWALNRQVWLSASFIKGTDNVKADRLSRKFDDQIEWSLNDKVFSKIQSLWGTLKIDLFASRLNRKCRRYVSWKPDPEASFIDAFSEN